MLENQQAHSTTGNARYVASWTIDNEGANSAAEASQFARQMQAPGTTPSCLMSLICTSVCYPQIQGKCSPENI